MPPVCCIPAGGGHDVLVSLVTGLSWLLVLLGRFVAGRPLDGRARTNCTYLRRGTRVLEDAPPERRWVYRPLAAWWAHAAGCERQAIRLGVSTGAGLVVYGWVTHPVLTMVAACCLTGLAAVTAARRAGSRHQALPLSQPGASGWPIEAVPVLDVAAEDDAEQVSWAADEVVDVMLLAVRRVVQRPAGSAGPGVSVPAQPELAVFPELPAITVGQPGRALTGQLGGQISRSGVPAGEAMARAVHEGWARS